MNFAGAIVQLKDGEKLTRKGWNGKGQYIFLAQNVTCCDSKGYLYASNNAIGFMGTSGLQVGWLASQADMLADDWEVYNNG